VKGIRELILPIGLAVMLVSVMATASIIGTTPFAFAQITITPGENVLSIDSEDPALHKINPDTAATISSVAITLDGSFPSSFFVIGGTGIAFNPVDGKTYALLKISDDPDTGAGGGGGGGGLDRHLATIDPQTGIATLVGNTGVKKISSLTFDSGTLYAVNIFDETLSTINTINGSVDNLCDVIVLDG